MQSVTSGKTSVTLRIALSPRLHVTAGPSTQYCIHVSTLVPVVHPPRPVFLCGSYMCLAITSYASQSRLPSDVMISIGGYYC
jgi:hypothetical protein